MSKGRHIHKTRQQKIDEAAPHGPDEPCTCDGCWACKGREIGCTCDIDWDALREASRE